MMASTTAIPPKKVEVPLTPEEMEAKKVAEAEAKKKADLAAIIHGEWSGVLCCGGGCYLLCFGDCVCSFTHCALTRVRLLVVQSYEATFLSWKRVSAPKTVV